MNLHRSAAAAAGLALLAAAGAACSDEDSVFNVEVGQCVEEVADLSGAVSELPDIDCDQDHEGEVIFLFEHEGDDDDYPGGDALEEEASEECEGDAFEDYTGTDFDESAIAILYITPSEDSWGDGDRETICVASTGEAVDESFEGNGEDFLLESGDTVGGGEDTSLEDFADLVESCEGGDMADCDELFRTTPVGSEAEEIGATCGGELEVSEVTDPGTCEEQLG
jgi:hypothetical protein